MVLFDWLPWGGPGSYHKVEVWNVQLLEHQSEFVWKLSELHVQVLELGEAEWRAEVRLLLSDQYKRLDGPDEEKNPLHSMSMSSTYQMNGDSY